jgi:DNA-binding transcriptional LysR family regulator/AraC-like DNA-binding protein
MDVLDEILGSLRLTGGVVIDGEFSGDFCVLAQFTPQHFAPFFPVPDTLISYHYVRSGQMLIEVEGLPPALIDAGTIAILPRNDPHTLASRSGLDPADAEDIEWVTSGGVHHVAAGTEGEKNEVWCGFLGAAKGTLHPLLDALPPLLTLDVSGGEADWLESSMRFLAEQSPPAEIVAKLAELFLAQAIREYIDKLPPSSKGWLRGLADPAVSKALSIIHTRYAEELDVESLAREAGVSRSVLGERFAELIGEPPMRYCAGWRMRVAANMLRDGKQSMANVAYAVGFNSEAAFNRAFKREFGEPPAAWRRGMESEEPGRTMADLRPDELFVSGTPTSIHWIMPRMGDFLDANPALNVQLDPDPRMIDFGEEDFDCAIRCGTQPPNDLVVEELFRVDFAPMCSPGFLERHPQLKEPSGLLDVPRITPNDPWWAALWKQLGIEAPPSSSRGVDMGAQVLDGLAAIGGQGLALLTPIFWRDELASGKLVCPLPDRLDGHGTYWLVYPENRKDWPKIRRFSEWLHKLCGQASAETSAKKIAA